MDFNVLDPVRKSIEVCAVTIYIIQVGQILISLNSLAVEIEVIHGCERNIIEI